jgi:ABC-type sugar transport system ATPase subunit
MVGRQVSQLYPERAPTASGEFSLDVQHLSGKGFKDISFNICAGEIVGLFGLVGSGRTELARGIFGAERTTDGRINICGSSINPRIPGDAIRSGLVLVPEDRKTQGLVLGLSLRENIALPNLRRLTRWGFMRFGEEKIIAEHFKTALDIRAPTIDTPAQSLSGGNQQKIVMSKWLAREPRVLILDEPTRGIDVGAKAEVHRLVAELTAQGVAVLLISSELPEVLGMSDRILVMHEGRLVGELSRADANEERIMALISLQSAAI